MTYGPPVQASLNETGTNNTVQFKINPQKITLSHSARLREIAASNKRKSPADSSASSREESQSAEPKGVLTQEALLQEVGATTFGLGDLTFDGTDVCTNCEQLLKWTNPSTSSAGTKNPMLPDLTFSWGTTLTYSVNLISADVSYERFTAGGQPVRAKVNLKFNIRTPAPTGTNPTSGGIPGRRSHTVVAGENLQHIAMASYGRPGAWRQLAAANGIEDPLAVPPGTVVYVPAPTELAELAAGSPR